MPRSIRKQSTTSFITVTAFYRVQFRDRVSTEITASRTGAARLAAVLRTQRYAHINPYGKYRFNVEAEFHRKSLRPLRLPDSGLA